MLSASQIVTLATQIAGASGMTSQCGQYLNALLSTRCKTYNFLFLQKIATLNIGGTNSASSATLPADYLRASERPFYSINGTICWIDQLPQGDLDILPQSPGINNYPRWYDTDLSPAAGGVNGAGGTMTFWPPSGFAIPITLKYYPLMPDIATPETSSSVPWFPDQKQLIYELAEMMAMHTGNELGDAWAQRAETLLGKFLVLSDDKSGFAQTVKKDARRFRSYDNLKVTKVTGW